MGRKPAEGGISPHQLSTALSGETPNQIGRANEGIKYG